MSDRRTRPTGGASDPDEDREAWLPPPHVLREYSLIADGYRGALIGPRGDIAWMCFPRWDSDATLSSLLGGRGYYVVEPGERSVWGGYYEDGTLIWHSRWVTDTKAIVDCREALAIPSSADTAVLLRQVSVPAGECEVEVVLDLRPGFGRLAMSDLGFTDGVWSGRAGPLRFRWSGAADARVVDHSGAPALRLRLRPARGQAHDLVLEVSTSPLREPPPVAAGLWDATADTWIRRVPPLDGALARRDARQAYAVLHALTYPGGGMVAAATMSLPERVNRLRNYDYRYAWVRDQCYAGMAAAAGGLPLMDDAVSFVTERLLEDGPKMAPAYTADGGPVPDEYHVGLPGYPGGTDVAGNHVNSQFQLDTFGEVLSLLAAAGEHQHLGTREWRAVRVAVAAVEENADRPDSGIWELEEQAWAHSRLTCVAGLRSIARRANRRDAGDWTTLADRLLADTAARAVHHSGRWQRTPDDERVDAALLLPPVRGALPPEDPRTRMTLEAVRTELAEDGYLYRFRHDARRLAEAEGAFLLCGFMMALACWQQGQHVRALHWFERNRASCGPPGLYSEEFDVVQRQLRGNLPQAFVHALLLECALRIAPGPEDADGGAERAIEMEETKHD
jgi:hypothetical protein